MLSEVCRRLPTSNQRLTAGFGQFMSLVASKGSSLAEIVDEHGDVDFKEGDASFIAKERIRVSRLLL